MTLQAFPSVFGPGPDLKIVRNQNDGTVSTLTTNPKPPAAQAPALPQLASGAELAQKEFSQSFVPTEIGEFVPETPIEGAQVLRGDVGGAAIAMWQEGMLGFGDKLELSLSERDAIRARASGFAQRAPVTSFAVGMVSRFGSDILIDIAVMMSTGVLGAGMELLATTNKFRSVASIQRINSARRTLEAAATSKNFGTKVVANAGIDVVEGAITGVLSEFILQKMGKGGEITDVLKAGLTDAAISPFFGLGIRSLMSLSGKSYEAVRLGYINRESGAIAKALGISQDRVKQSMDEVIPLTIDDLTPAARAEFEVQKRAQPAKMEESTRPADVNVETPVKDFDPDTAGKAVDEFNSKPSKPALINLMEATFKDADKPNIPKYADIIEMRAKSAGMTLKEWFKAKNIGAKMGETLSIIARDGKLILEAPKKAIDGDDFLHEIGHIVRSDIGGKHLTELEKAYGIEPGQPWDRAAEEQFADDIVARISDLSEDQPRGLRRAIDAFTNWLKETYGKLFGMDKNASKNEVLARLFTEISDEPFATPSAAREAEVQLEREVEGLTQLRAEDAPRKKEKPVVKRKTQNAQVVATQLRLTDIETDMADPSKGVLGTDSVVPKVKGEGASKQFATLEAMGDFGPAALFSATNFLPFLGPTFNRLMQDGATRSILNQSRLKLGAEAKLKDAATSIGMTVDQVLSMGKKKKHTFQISTKFEFVSKKKGTLKTLGIKDVELNLTDSELIDIKASAMDGLKKDGKATKGSSQIKMVDNTAGIIVDGKKYLLTKEQLVKIQADDFLPPKLQTLYRGMRAGLDTFRPTMKAIGKRTTGRDLADAKNLAYWPQFTMEKASSKDLLFEELINGKDINQARGAIAKREGNAPLVIGDSFAKFLAYTNRMSQLLSHVELHKDLTTAFKGGRLDIRTNLGPHHERTIKTMIDNLVGRDVQTEFNDGAIVKALFSLRQLGILSLKLSVVLKQWSSAWTASSLRHVTGKELKGKKVMEASGFEIALEAGRLAIDRGQLNKDWAEITGINPMVLDRSLGRKQQLEFNTGEAGDIARMQALTGELSLKELSKLITTKGVSKLDTLVAGAEKGMIFVTEADRIMLTAIWNKLKEQVKKRDNESEGSRMSRVNMIFTHVLEATQPTTSQMSKSVLQSKSGLPFRAMTGFQTQTRRNAELAFLEAAVYQNIPKEFRTKEDRDRFVGVISALLAGTAFATAMGTIASETEGVALSAIRSEERNKRIEARRQSLARRIFHRGIRDVFGQLPGPTGAVASSLFNGITGGHVFSSEVPVFSELESLTEGGIASGIETAFGILGLPRAVVGRPAGELVRRITE